MLLNKTYQLYNGSKIPALGLGTYIPNYPGEVERATKIAIDCGFRHFDCAWIYRNESEIGAGIRAKIEEGIITRNDVFVTTKLWNNFHNRDSVLKMLRHGLQAMKLQYVDLYLIHWPTGFKEDARTLPLFDGPSAWSNVDYLETWRGMEDCVKCGFTKNIGLANFNSYQVERILANCQIKPAVLQIEIHPQFDQRKLRNFCQERDIVVCGTSPLGINELSGMIPGFGEPTIQEAKVIEVAAKYNKTPAQIVLNYLVNWLDVCVVPKSVTKAKIVEYANSFDFELDSEDVKYLETCNVNHRVSPFLGFCDHPYYPFKAEY